MKQSNRNFYLKTCYTLERSDFSHLSSFLSENKHEQAGTNNLLKVPKIKESQKVNLKWFNEFEILFLEGKKLNIISNIIVHGSIGDFTNNNFSDFDFTIYLDDDVLEEKITYSKYKSWLKKLYKLLFKIDPLQHHGPFYLWNNLKNRYSNNILPLMVYEDTWAMESTDLSFNVIQDTGASNINSLSLDLCQNIINADKILFRFGYNLFAIKRYLSYWMLIPAFYYTDIGKPTKKAESFIPFYEEFGIESEPIKLASDLRKNWPALPEWYQFLLPVFSHSKISRRASSLMLLNKNMKEIILNELQPKIILLEKKLSEKLCTKL